MKDNEILKLALQFSSDVEGKSYSFELSNLLEFAKTISKKSYIKGSNDCHKSMKFDKSAGGKVT
jgi:hypothetical protein